MPLVDAGLVNLIPDPCSFDAHLRDQMLQMAQERSFGHEPDARREVRLLEIAEEDAQRSIMSLPRDALRAQLRKVHPELDDEGLDDAMRGVEQIKENDPLMVLQEDSLAGGKEGGQLIMMKLAPNFEMAMYLAQATGACIVTDCHSRWSEIERATRRARQDAGVALAQLSLDVSGASFRFPQSIEDILKLQSDGTLSDYSTLMRDASKYSTSLATRDRKPNYEAHLVARFAKLHTTAQNKIKKAMIRANLGCITCSFPVGGIRDTTVSRLLLMSSSERHLPSVPMAVFIDRTT